MLEEKGGMLEVVSTILGRVAEMGRNHMNPGGIEKNTYKTKKKILLW